MVLKIKLYTLLLQTNKIHTAKYINLVNMLYLIFSYNIEIITSTTTK